MRILIISPFEFKSYLKYKRKINRLTKNIPHPTLVPFIDHHGFCERYSLEMDTNCNINHHHNDLESIVNSLGITKAIIFDDGEEFFDEGVLLRGFSVDVKVTRIKITRVVNIKKEPFYQSIKNNDSYEYIGRGSYWGNPYSQFEYGETKETALHKFKYDFDRDLFPNKKKDEVHKLSGKRLGCFCAPYDCHGYTLANYLNSYDDGE